MPSRRGLANIVYLPDQGERLPALIIELKWNKTENAAIAQIKNHKYPTALNKYSGNIILVGINYDEKTKKHSCKIETIVNYIGFVFIYEMPREKNASLHLKRGDFSLCNYCLNISCSSMIFSVL